MPRWTRSSRLRRPLAERVPASGHLPGQGAILGWATGLVCLLPPARNVGPGLYGYLWTGAVASIALVLVLVAWGARRPVPQRRSGAVRVATSLSPFLVLLAWGGLTLSWSTTPHRRLALAALVLAGLCALLPGTVVAQTEERSLSTSLQVVAGAALGASAVATVITWLMTVTDGRFALPLGPASASYLPITLCVAVAAGAAASAHGAARWAWGTLVLVGCLLIVVTDSRAGMGALVVLVWVVLARSSRPGVTRVAVSMGGGLIAVVSALAYLRWQRPGAGATDGLRTEVYAQGLQAWGDSGWLMLLGRGSGSVWPWLAVEMRQVPTVSHEIIIESPWGDILYHAHSTPLGVLVELGLVGLVLLLVSVGVVAAAAVITLRDPAPQRWLPAAALVCTLPGMMLETFLLRGFPGAIVWWAVALTVVRWALRARTVRRPAGG